MDQKTITNCPAIDSFTRKKNESLVTCMDRCIVDIDKLRLFYPHEGWFNVRQQMRRHILMQLIKTETKRHVQMQEDALANLNKT